MNTSSLKEINEYYDRCKNNILKRTYTEQSRQRELTINENNRRKAIDERENAEYEKYSNTYDYIYNKFNSILAETKSKIDTLINEVEDMRNIELNKLNKTFINLMSGFSNEYIEAPIENHDNKEYLTKLDKTEILQHISDIRKSQDMLATVISDKSSIEHVHTLKEIIDINPTVAEALASDIDERATVNFKLYADKHHKHDVSDIEGLTSSGYDDTKLRDEIDKKLDANLYNKGYKTYKITNTNYTNLTDKPLAYVPIGYIEQPNTTSKGYIAHFIINLVATNDKEVSIFESAEVSIGHVMNNELSSSPVMGISTISSNINGGNRKIGLGLVAYEDNSVYEVDLILVGYNDYYRVALNITCEVDTYIKLYTNDGCKTELNQISNTKPAKSIENYSRFQSYSLANNELDSKADIEHTHNINELTDYETYDTEIRGLIDGKADNGHTHTIYELTDYDFYDEEVKTLINSKLSVINYKNFEDITDNWKNIPYPSIIFANDSEPPEDFNDTIIIKQNHARSLCISSNKTIRDHIWIKFQGHDDADTWTNASEWRKIPVLDNTIYDKKWARVLTCLNPSLENGNVLQLVIGKADERYQRCQIAYKHLDNENSVMSFGFHSHDDAITFSKCNASINLPLTITDNTYYDGVSKVLTCLYPKLLDGQMMQIILGKADERLQRCHITYKHSDNENSVMSFGFHSYDDIISFTKDGVKIAPPVICTNSITAPNIDAMNERIEAIESKLRNHNIT